MLRGVILIAAAAVALLAAACSSGGGESENESGDTGPAGVDLTATAEEGGITVEAEWLLDLGAADSDLSAYPADEFIAVDITLDTHSGDLGSIDMAESSQLRQGDVTLAPEAWIDVNDDSHHREGILVFPREVEEGAVEIVVNLPDGAVSLRWDGIPEA
jgi:hypothetical protein